jgi:F-type H+-transporting ATPase subunit b
MNAGACELKRNLAVAVFVATLLVGYAGLPASASARVEAGELRRDPAVAAYGRDGGQDHAPAPSAPAAADHAQPADEHAAAAEHAAEGGHDESIGGMIRGMAWPVANFIIFLGVLYYFFNKPFTEYLAGRSATIRKDLVEAAELRANANAQLAAIEQKLQALPGELNTLRARGAEDIKAEEQRIAAAAAADRERMLEQTRREIELQVRLAKKEILEHAADLSVQLATERIKKEVTPDDQSRLVDRYLDQVKKS